MRPTVYIRGFHAGHPQEEVKLFALDSKTGKERWISADAVTEVYGETGGSVFCLNKAGHLVELNTPPNSSLEGFDVVSGKSLYHTQEVKFTQFSDPVEADGVLYHTSVAMMKEGKSGVWAYRLP